MKRKVVIFLMLLTAASFAPAKPKRHGLPEAFESAKTVHVETLDGRDITDLSLDRETRETILDVQDAIQHWGRYSLSRSRHEADLILVIYKGRLRSNPNGTPTLSVPLSSSGPMSRGPNQDPADASQGSNNGSPDGLSRERDKLTVNTLDTYGKFKSTLWHNELDRGLEAPNLTLLQRLEHEIDKAYPGTPTSGQSNP